ncbi:MAG: HNH endonuclease signature motif containing protein [Actinomycetota bacterium]
MTSGQKTSPRSPDEVNLDTFMAKVRKDPSGCWLWTGKLNDWGYGYVRTGSRKTGRKVRRAHRVAYELLVGPIPADFQLDHVCRVRHCVNPAHLEPVTPRVNTRRSAAPTALNARKTLCINGHPFDAANTRIDPRGWRCCRQCERDRQAKRRGERVRLAHGADPLRSEVSHASGAPRAAAPLPAAQTTRTSERQMPRHSREEGPRHHDKGAA